LKNEEIELVKDIKILKQELDEVFAKIFKARVKESIQGYKNQFLSNISSEELKLVESTLIELGFGSISSRDAIKRKAEAEKLKASIKYAINLKESLDEKLSNEQDSEILKLISKLSKIDTKKFINFNKELRFSSSFKVSDFKDFNSAFEDVERLIVETIGSRSQKSLKDAKSKIANIKPSLLGKNSAEISRLNILKRCKEIYLKRNIFSFLFDSYRGTVGLLSSFGINHKDENAAIKLIDNLILCLEKYESIYANSISELFIDENKIIELSKKR
jgi:hypothetical protein